MIDPILTFFCYVQISYQQQQHHHRGREQQKMPCTNLHEAANPRNLLHLLSMD